MQQKRCSVDLRIPVQGFGDPGKNRVDSIDQANFLKFPQIFDLMIPVFHAKLRSAFRPSLLIGFLRLKVLVKISRGFIVAFPLLFFLIDHPSNTLRSVFVADFGPKNTLFDPFFNRY